MKHNHPNHIILRNSIDGEFKCFHRKHGVPLKAEAYGTPISNGKTVDDCIHGAICMGVKRWDIEVIE